jgi:hypothetical protein
VIDHVRKGLNPMIWLGCCIADAVTPNSAHKVKISTTSLPRGFLLSGEGARLARFLLSTSLRPVKVEVAEHAQHGLWRPFKAPDLQVEAATPSWALLGFQHVAPYKDMLVGSTKVLNGR